MKGKLKVFIACSLDGFIAAADDDLSWLPEFTETSGDRGFGEFFSGVGALLMGRRTYDVVAAFTGEWPYGETPVLVASHRPLDPVRPTVRAVTGTISDVITQAYKTATEKDVYLDGGDLIRQALDAGLVDQITITVVPVILGQGIPLFAGTSKQHQLKLVSSKTLDAGLVQLTYST